jgi:hypothetical protein
MRFIVIILLLQLQLLARCQTSINNYNQLFAKNEESLSYIQATECIYNRVVGIRGQSISNTEPI